MTAKEAAGQLIEKHEDIYQLESLAVEHSILTVNIILEQLYRVDFYRMDDATIMIGYWSEVLKEIKQIK